MKEVSNSRMLQVSDEAFKVGEAVAHSLMSKIVQEKGSQVDAIYCLGNMITALVQNMATMLAKIPAEVEEEMRAAVARGDMDHVKDNFNPNKMLTAESKLFAILLCNKMSPDYDTDKLGSTCELGPATYWEAIQAFEKLAGYAPDPYITPGLIEVGRNAGSMGADMLKAFVERNRLEGPNSLN